MMYIYTINSQRAIAIGDMSLDVDNIRRALGWAKLSGKLRASLLCQQQIAADVGSWKLEVGSWLMVVFCLQK